MRESDHADAAPLRTRALDVHEVGVGGLHKTLELVTALLVLSGGVEEVDGERLIKETRISAMFSTTRKGDEAETSAPF